MATITTMATTCEQTTMATIATVATIGEQTAVATTSMAEQSATTSTSITTAAHTQTSRSFAIATDDREAENRYEQRDSKYRCTIHV